MLATWSRVPHGFLNPARLSGSSLSIVLSILLCIILSSILLVCDIKAIVLYLSQLLASPFLNIGIKVDPFQSSLHFPVFHMLLHIFVIIFIVASSPAFISSMDIPSCPGALLSFSCLIAHSTSAFMTSGSISKSVVSVCSFSILLSSLYSSSEYSFHLFFIPSPSPITFPSLDFREPSFGVNFLVISFTFENISLVLPFFPSSSITLHMSFRCFSLSFRAFFWNALFNDLTLYLSPTLFASFLSSAILMASFESHGVVLPLFFFGMCFSAVSNIVLFILSHNSFASSSSSISSLSRISNLFFISTLYSGVIPLQSYTFILSPVSFSFFSFVFNVATNSS